MFWKLGSIQICLKGSSWEKAIKIHITKETRLFLILNCKTVVWLIRAIINGNIIIQASISKRSHLNEYIFCLRAVAASEPLKRKERKEKRKENRRSHWLKALENGVGRTLNWKQELEDPGIASDLTQSLWPWIRPVLTYTAKGIDKLGILGPPSSDITDWEFHSIF